MERGIQAALIVAGLIHFLPVAGVIGADQLTSMYALPFDERNLVILMRHRAVSLAWSTGGYNQALSAVVFADTIAVVCFLVATALSVIALRSS
jgi:hypothetical protein